LAWANESWSRRWLGEERDILVEQTYSNEDDFRHIHWLMRAFSDSRYIKIDGRPLFLIYRPRHLPDPKRTVEVFRNECIKKGLPDPFLLGIDAHCPNFDCRGIGFDGTVKFEPQLGFLQDFMNDKFQISKIIRNKSFGILSTTLKIYDYAQSRIKMNYIKPEFPYYKTIFVGWDNTPRRGRNGIIIVNSTPENFASGLADIIGECKKKPVNDRIFFINAWNEWAEGNHLEPDLRFGNQYLQKVKEIKNLL
jgi:hypothetical protein